MESNTVKRILSNDTPRRSARKSVRPPLDYEDIIQKDKKDTAEEEEEQATQKWKATEVGRHSRKRNRSRKAKQNKKAKIEEDELEKVEAEEEEELEEKQHLTEQKREKRKLRHHQLEDQKLKEQQLEENQLKLEKQQLKNQLKAQQLEKQQLKEELKEQKLEEQQLQAQQLKEQLLKEQLLKEQQLEELQLKNTQLKEQLTEEGVEDQQSKDQNLNEQELESAAATASLAAIVNTEEMVDLGLSPLLVEEQPMEEEDPDILVEEDVLNRTFDANDKSSEAENELALNTVPQQAEDKTEDAKQQPSVHHKGFRFPTPFKDKSKPIFQFNDCPTISGSAKKSLLLSHNMSLHVPSGARKRSISICGLNEAKAKTVSFVSPIEVANVIDIDKRWEALNIAHVTHRRKRSKSLDESRQQLSRIPRPKQYAPIKAVTPSKLKARTKLPNFTAMHQKQFDKMESLVDHIERKALRAKLLTNSAVKRQQQQQQPATIASGQKKLPVGGNLRKAERSRAVKKIDIRSCPLSPMTAEEQERQRLLPTPRKIVSVAQTASHKSKISTRSHLTGNTTKPAFNLSTCVAGKIFTSTSTSTSNPKPVDPLPNKMEARRQRHMDMFKGRTAQERRGDMIRGVRSNRRFELQMQHRRQMDENAR